MRSRLAQQARKDLLEAEQRLTPEERLQAHVQLTRLLVELYDAGRKLRDAEQPRDRKDPPP